MNPRTPVSQNPCFKIMEKRNSKRIFIGFDAEIIYEGSSYTAVIDNLSENGVSVITVPAKTELDFTPGATLKLKFQSHPGETLILHCKVKWSRKIPPHGLTHRIGLEIKDPPWDKSNYFL